MEPDEIEDCLQLIITETSVVAATKDCIRHNTDERKYTKMQSYKDTN